MAKNPSYEKLLEKISRLEKANDELREQLQYDRYIKAILKNTDDGIVIINEKGFPQAYNEAYAKAIEENVGISMTPGVEPYKALKDPEAVAYWKEIKERALKGERFRSIYRHVLKDGSANYFEFSICPIKSGNQLMGYTQISRDITQQMLFQERLREKETLLDHSEKIANIGSFIWDLRTNELLWSPNMYAIHGVREEEFSGKLFEENQNFIHPEDRKAVARQIDEMVDAGSIWPMHFRIVKPDGKERKISSNGALEFDEQGRPVKCFGIYQDVTDTKQMEIELANRNVFIETVLEQLPIGVAVTSISTGVSSLINKKFEEIYGWPKEDIPDLKSFFQKVYPEESYRRSVRQKVVDDVLSGDLSRMKWEDLNATTKTGEKRVISTVTIPLFEQDLIISTVLDNTERYNITESLKEFKERYQALFDRSLDCVCLYDMEGKFVDGNQAYFDLTGYNKEEIIRIDGLAVIHPDSRKDFMRTRAKLLREGHDEVLGEYKILTKSGASKFIEIRRSIIYKENEPHAVQSFIRDISLRKKIEAELDKKVESLNLAEQIAKLGYFEFSYKSGVFYRSPGFFQLLGYSVDDPADALRPGIFPEHFHDEDRERVEKWVQDFLQKPKPSDIKFRVVQVSGNIIRVHAVVKVIFNDKNEPQTIIGTVQDITHQHELEEQVRQAQKMESIGTLAGGIAHDFNNLLSIILGNSELALEEIPEWYSSREFLSQIRNASLKGRSVVRQLLSFTRKVDESLKPTDILPIVTEAINVISSAAHSGIHFHKNMPDTCPEIMANANQIHQLIISICTNAIEAIDKEGDVTVKIENVSAECFPEDLLPDVPRGDYVLIKVKDTGHGIEPDIINRIFDPYFTTKEFGKGPGMGLSVAHGIIKSHEGYINLESAVNHGTCFEIYFPVIKDQPKAKKASAQDEMPGGKENILYVDDEEGLVALGVKLLEKLGYKVKGCTDPKEAISLVQSDPQGFDLIITDMAMPDITGEELAEEVNKVNPKLPIILCSGYSDQMDEARSKELMIYSFLSKPVELKKMAQSVRNALDCR